MYRRQVQTAGRRDFDGTVKQMHLARWCTCPRNRDVEVYDIVMKEGLIAGTAIRRECQSVICGRGRPHHDYWALPRDLRSENVIGRNEPRSQRVQFHREIVNTLIGCSVEQVVNRENCCLVCTGEMHCATVVRYGAVEQIVG